MTRVRAPNCGARIPRIIVTQCPSAAVTIRKATADEKPRPSVAGFSDFLPSGPLLPLDDIEAFCASRSQFWRFLYGTHLFDFRGAAPEVYTDFDHLISSIKNAEQVDFWLGKSVEEQIFAAFLAALCDQGILEAARIELLQFDPRENWPSLGAQPVKFFKMRPAPVPFTSVLADYNRGWSAITSPEPDTFASLVRSGTDCAALNDALADFFLRYPDAQSGLGSIDRSVLEYTPSEWVKATHVVGRAMALGTVERDRVGDLTIFAHLKGLALGPFPCVELRGDASSMQTCEARLTPFGADCLAGKENRLANGIDEWIGGVHLESANKRVWVRRKTEIVPF